jgi:hypothetical protein
MKAAELLLYVYISELVWVYLGINSRHFLKMFKRLHAIFKIICYVCRLVSYCIQYTGRSYQTKSPS